MDTKDRLIIALDVDSGKKALAIVEKLKCEVRFFKVGLELFSSAGPAIVGEIKKAGCEVFLDLKFHDIPTTVAKAACAVVGCGPFMFNVHALGGYDMMKKTADEARQESERLKMRAPKILAVTVLTSMDENGLKKIGVDVSIEKEVLALAALAKDAGLDGVVASPKEAGLIRKNLGKDFLIVTPGVRPAWAASNDQKRIMTPAEAVKTGSDFIVVGRPVTEARDPARAAKDILKEIGA